MLLKRAFLWTLIVSLSLAALVGVVVILFNDIFHLATEEIVGTLLTVSFFSLTSLGAAIVLERNRWRFAMLLALAISGVGLLDYLLMIWFFQSSFSADWVWQVMWLLGVWAVALPHAGLLSLAQLRGGVWRWVQVGAFVAVFSLASVISAAVVFEADDDLAWRMIGILAIFSVLGTIAIPVLSKVHRIDRLTEMVATRLDVSLKCPRCLFEQTVASGYSRCSRCRLKFHIEIEEPRCPGCNYLLHQLTTPECPECGRVLGKEEVVAG